MKYSLYLHELLYSGITLNEKETHIVEDYIQSQSEPVKPSHLNHYKCLSAARNRGQSTGI